MMKYVKPRKIYEGEQKEFKFINENLNEGRKLSRGNYKIDWPLTDKYAEWLPKEIKDVEAIEYDDGEWGGFEINRNWTDKNPIQNFNDDYLAQKPGNLFYNKTKIGSMSITSYNVTSDDHVVAKMKLRIVKVNNGKKDGYIIFYEFDIDSGFDEYEEGTIALDSWARVMKLLKRCRDNMKSEDGFYKVLDSRAQTAVKFLLGESEVFEESLNEASHGKLVDQAATIDAAARNWTAPAQKKWEEECEDLFYDYSGDGDGGTVEVTWDDIEDRDLKEIIKTARQIMKQYGIKESVNEAKINDKIQPKLLPFSKVKLGSVGIDYFNKPAYVIGIGKYSELEHFDQAGLADGFENDEDCVAVISLDDWDRGNKRNTAVFTYGDDGFAIYEEEEINEGLALSIAGGIVLGLAGAFAAVKGMKFAGKLGSNILDNVVRAGLERRDRLEAKKHYKEILVPIVQKFEGDKELEKMYQDLNPYMEGFSKKANENNKERTKKLNKVAKYIKSKLNKEEEHYFSQVSSILRQGDFKSGSKVYKVGESVNEAKGEKVTKKMWDKDWSLDGRMSAKEYDEKWNKRHNSLLSVFKDPDDAEKHIEKKYNDLPSVASHMVLYESVNEGRKRIRVKRKYGENHPEKTVGKYAPVREAILRHIREKGGTISKNDLLEFIKGMNEDRGTKTTWGWVRRNSKYIKETRNGFKLTRLGERVIRATSLNESLLLTEGQFSWMTQDTGNQIGSERMNTIFVTMFDDKGNRYEEKGYDGYGMFGGKDYYELLAEMNGINKDNVDELIAKCKVRVFGNDLTSKLRQCGIELAFESNKKLSAEAAKITGTKKIKYPALYEYPNKFNKNRHDFYREAESDPNQSWYVEEEYDDDGYF